MSKRAPVGAPSVLIWGKNSSLQMCGVLIVDDECELMWPAADGQMGARIRAFDWASTSLGPIKGWPHSLRTAVDMVLAMPAPATILWGPEQVQIYNDAYITIAQERHPGLLGRPVSEGWPDAYDDVIAPLLAEARAGRATHLIGFRAPLRGADGQLEERVFDTDWSPIRDHAGAVAGALQIVVEVTRREQIAAALRESEARLQAAIELVGLSPYSWNPITGAVDWDSRLKAMWGLPPHAHADKEVFLSAIHREDRPCVEAAIAQCIDPAGSGLYAIEYRVIGIEDGIERWVYSRGRTALECGQPVGFIGAVLDITAHKRAEEALRESEGRARLLLTELQHRVRNILAMIRSVATRTANEYTSANDHAQHLAGRLDAMARTQAILTRRPGKGVEMEELIRDELLAQSGAEDRLRIEGPGVLLSPKAAEVLTLAVHELATNSIKYGSLGADGELSITWDVEARAAENWVTLLWDETGVEISASASRRGFGTELITKRIPYELGGAGAIEFGIKGMRATIAFPLRSAGSILETGPTSQEEQV